MFVIKCNKSEWNLPNTNKLYQSFCFIIISKIIQQIYQRLYMHQRLYQSFFVYKLKAAYPSDINCLLLSFNR